MHVFRRHGARWMETDKLLATAGAENDLFGGSVSLSSSGVLWIGAPSAWGAPDAPGSAFVFGLSKDVNGSGLPDECDELGDINGDGVVGT